MIPVLIVPILNRPDLLDAMLASIDHPVDQIIVIDNGGVVGDLANAHVIRMPHNIGVAASWNLGIKASPRAPWWFIANSDITFGPGDLARLDAAVNPQANAVYYTLGMAGFAVTYHAINAVGWWDEAITPAYNEDIDWQRRARLVGTLEVDTGFTGTHVGSATIHSDPVLQHANGITHGLNDAYYAAKWGGPKQGGETFSTPFNRGGHVGDWRGDIERLRNQAWPKR